MTENLLTERQRRTNTNKILVTVKQKNCQEIFYFLCSPKQGNTGEVGTVKHI